MEYVQTITFLGIRVAFPALCRTLEPEEVVERTVRAMAERQFLVVLPRLFYLALFLKRSVGAACTSVHGQVSVDVIS